VINAVVLYPEKDREVRKYGTKGGGGENRGEMRDCVIGGGGGKSMILSERSRPRPFGHVIGEVA
jgi:hypothetical protein